MSDLEYFFVELLGLVFWGSITLAIAIKRNKSRWWFFAGLFHFLGVVLVLCTSNKEDEYREYGNEHDRLFGSTERTSNKAPKHVIGSAESYNDQGLVCVEQKRYSMAITNFTKAIEISPDYARPYYNRALAFEQQGKKQEAIDDYQRFIAINDLSGLTEEANRRLLALSDTDD